MAMVHYSRLVLHSTDGSVYVVFRVLVHAFCMCDLSAGFAESITSPRCCVDLDDAPTDIVGLQGLLRGLSIFAVLFALGRGEDSDTVRNLDRSL